MSKANQTFDVQIRVTDVNDVQHVMNSSIAAELVDSPAARADITAYLLNRSKDVIVKKIGESL